MRRRRKEDILGIKVDQVQNKFEKYKQKWSNHINRMEDIRHPK
jgi:hypothetical protein